MYVSPRKLSSSDFKDIWKMTANLVKRNSALWALFPIIAACLIIPVHGTFYYLTNLEGLAAISLIFYIIFSPITLALISLSGLLIAVRSDKTLPLSEIFNIASKSIIQRRFMKLVLLGITGHLLLLIFLAILVGITLAISPPDPTDPLISPKSSLSWVDILIGHFSLAVCFYILSSSVVIGGVLHNIHDIDWTIADNLADQATSKNPFISGISLCCIFIYIIYNVIFGHIPVVGPYLILGFQVLIVIMAPYAYTYGYVLTRELFFDQGNTPVKEKSAHTIGSLKETFS